MKRTGISLVALLFGLGFAALGSLFLFVAAREFIATADTYTWTKVPATLQSVDIEYPPDRPNASQGNVFELVARYDYTYEGQARTGTQIQRTPYTSDSYQELADKKWQIIRNEWQHAFVDPEHPNSAVLEHGSLWIGLLILFPLPFIGVGIISIAVGLGFFDATKATPRPKSTRTIRSEGVRSVFGSVFLVAGVLLLYCFCYQPWRNSRQAKQWEQVPCRVIWSRVRAHDDDDGVTYSPDIFYEYSYEGKTYRSNRYSFATGSSSGRKGKREIVKQFPAGAETECFVDAATPWHAVLDRDAPAGSMVLMGLVGCLFAGVGGGLAVPYLARKIRHPSSTVQSS